MISKTQAFNAITETDGVEFDSVSEKFVGLHEDYFLFRYKDFECKMSFKRDSILTISFTTNICEFQRSWDLNKQENVESFQADIQYFFDTTMRKTK